MSRPFFVLFILLVLTVSGCAEAPPVDYDLLQVKDDHNPQNHLAFLREKGELVAASKFTSGNDVELLQDGAAAYPAMLKAIAGAKRRIDMESYEFDDGAGKRFAEALLKRRKAGVEVNLIYDFWGSSDTSDKLFDKLRAGGVRVVEYNPTDDAASLFDFSINDRDHRKMLLIDSKIAFTGGINVSHVYKRQVKHVFNIFKDDDDVGYEKLPWRDTEVRIEGPVVAEFERFFMSTWRQQKGHAIPPPLPTPPTLRGGLDVQAIDGTPGREHYGIYRSMLLALTLAQTSIHLTTAYFVPPPAMIDALKKAAQRGVEVVLILPSESDSDLALHAGRGYYEELLDAGVQIYEREGAVLHAKTAIIDGEWSTIGSSNLDMRSVVFNNECNAVVLGKPFGSQMESMFKNDLAQSRPIKRDEWGQRPFWEALNEWKARLVEDLL